MSFWKKTFGFFISGVFLWFALRKVEWTKVPEVFSSINLWFIFPLLISLTLEHLIRSYRWKMILEGRNISFYNLYAGLMLGNFFNNVFPARAGEVIRAVFLGRKKIVRTSEALGSIFFERFLDGIAVVTYIGIAISIFPVTPMVRKAGYTAMFFYFLVMVFIVIAQFGKKWVDKITYLLMKPFPDSWRTKIISIQDSFINGFSMIRNPALFLSVVFVSYVAWFFSGLSMFLYLKIFSLSLGFTGPILLMAVLSIGAMLPSSPGMIGIFEYCCQLVLAEMLGFSQELAASFGIFTHFISYIYILVIALFILTIENLSISELEKNKEDAEYVSAA